MVLKKKSIIEEQYKVGIFIHGSKVRKLDFQDVSEGRFSKVKATADTSIIVYEYIYNISVYH